MAYLTIQPAQGKKSQIPFDGDLIRVGRSSRNDVHLASDPSLSRFHAEFAHEGDDYYVRDAGSRNGTYTIASGSNTSTITLTVRNAFSNGTDGFVTAERANDNATFDEPIIALAPVKSGASLNASHTLQDVRDLDLPGLVNQGEVRIDE